MTNPTLGARPRSRWKLYLAGTVVGVIALGVLYVGLAFSWAYSEGERAGQLRKFSKKGWICKTWEGEVAQSISAGLAPEVWLFSVRDERVAAKVNAAIGKNVTLHYREIRGKPTSCFGDSNYFVDSVVAVQP